MAITITPSIFILPKEVQLKNEVLKSTKSEFQEYYQYGFSLLSNISYYYQTSNIENKHRILGLICPEKLVFDKKTFQTTKPSEMLSLLFNGNKGFGDRKKIKSSKNAAQSCVVTSLGFKPKTFSSVVRRSIQLSYEANFWIANIRLYTIYTK